MRIKTLRYAATLQLPLSLLLLSSLCPFIDAQIFNVATQNVPAIPVPGSAFAGTLTETVNPADGSLTLRLPVPTATGRGPKFPFAIQYSSNQVNHLEVIEASGECAAADYSASNPACNLDTVYVNEAWLSNPGILATDGWSYTIPTVSATANGNHINPGGSTASGVTSATIGCYWFANYIFQDVDGSEHSLGLSSPVPTPAGTKTACSFIPSTYNSSGDDFFQSQVTQSASSSEVPPQISIAGVDGTVYTAGGIAQSSFVYNGNNAQSYSGLVTSIEDRNGNLVTIKDASITNQSLRGDFTVVDSAQRTIISSDGFGVSGTHISTSVLSSPYTLSWTSTTSNYSVPQGPEYDPDNVCQINIDPVNRSTTGISVVALPNSTSYTISYDPVYALVDKIQFPTGGYVRYQWGMSSPSFVASYPNGCAEAYGTPVVLSRYVSFNGITEVEEDDFSYSTSFNSSGAGWISKQTKVTIKDLLSKTSALVIHNYVPMATPNPDRNQNTGTALPASMVEASTYTYDTTGALLQTVQQTWADLYLVSTQKTTLPTSGTSEIDYSYGYAIQSDEPVSNTPGVLIEKDEYDFGNPSSSGSPTRKTVITPQGFGILPTYPGFQALLDKPASMKTYQGSTLLAETDYVYGNAVIPVPNVTGHDETSYGPNVSPDRGNPVTITRQCFPQCSSSISTLSYDETGQVTSLIDARNLLTQYSYKDAYVSGGPSSPTNAYLTTVTYPNTGVAHTESFNYNYNSGLLASATDQNGQPTNYSYSDPLSRITLVEGPPDANNGGQRPTVQTTYDDATPSFTTYTTLNTSGTQKVITTMLDHMGHPIQSQLTSDPAGTDVTDTTYDGLGRIASVSNPYRSSTESTYGITSYSYDALDRKILQCNPDNVAVPTTVCSIGSSYKQWVYNGAITDIYDENRHHWQQTQDSFGRLKKVLEPDPHSNGLLLETDYTYDALNDLVSATQWGGAPGATGARTRTFSYDSLSRLTIANNPENGTTCYGQLSTGSCVNGYDGNGNLIAKTDARGIVTSYIYDALNRVLSKTYANDPSESLVSCYQYDSSSVPNSIGRMTTQWTQSASVGSCSLSNAAWTKRAILRYDSMGRIVSEQQYTPATIATGNPYTPTYTYDLAGDLITSTDGVTPVPTAPGSTLTFTNCIDGASRLQTLSSNWMDSTHPQSLFSAQGAGSSPCVNTSSPTLSSPSYAAFGSLTNAILGKGLTLTRRYDNRLRITVETDAGSATTAQTTGSTSITVNGAEQSQ